MYHDHEFAELCAAIALGRKNADQTRLEAQRLGASERVETILRGGAGTTIPTSPGWGSELVDYATVAESFIASLANVSVFDRLLADMVRLPLRTRAVATTLAPVAGAVNEGALKVISQLDLSDAQVTERKAAALVVLSEELMRLSGVGVELLNREMLQAVAKQTDAAFLGILQAATSATPSAGTDAIAVRHDVATALAAINTGDASRVHAIVSPSTAKTLATMGDASGASAFPDMGINGGILCSLPCHVSDALEDTGSPSTASMIVVDAAQIAAAAGEPIVSAATHATITAGETTFNLWQENLVGLMVERYFGAEVMREGAAAEIDGIAYETAEPAS